MNNSIAYEQLIGAANNKKSRVLFSGATILTMDPKVPDLPVGDLLIEGNRIAAVGTNLSAAANDGAAIVIDASGRILIPGFQDTHRHCWQNQLRRLIPDCDDNSAYLAVTHEWVGFHYRPHDIYVGNLIAALGCLDAGITCCLDFFHNPRTPAHSDAAVAAFRDAGIRGVHASCGVLAGEWDHSWPGDLKRLQAQYFGSQDQLLSMRVGVIAADFAGPDITLNEDKVRLARQMGLPLISDGVVGTHSAGKIERLGAAGLLGPDLTFIHCLDLSDTAWKLIADNGVNVSIPTTSDAQIGIWESVPSIQRALDVGIRPSLSVDVEVVLGSDMFTQMRTLLNIQRMMTFNRRYRGDVNFPAPLGVKDMLELATVQGAKVNGVIEKSGTLTPGKRADIVSINALDWNTMPLNNAFGTVVSGADSRNIDMVMVDGVLKKWGSELVGFDINKVRKMVEESRDYVLAAAKFDHSVLEQRHGLSKHHACAATTGAVTHD
jgi:cytosine/adenosine deaminase-related metal-dependent hydrolase